MNTNAARRRQHQERHWLGEPIIEKRGTYDQVAEAIPLFARRQFALYTAPSASNELPFLTGENPYYDEVVRINDSGEPDVPVGIVSKSYKLIQHRGIFDTTVKALHESQVPLGKVTAFLTLTQFGGRMALRFVLPKEFGFDPGDRHPLHLRLECFNSVDGSTRLVFLMSWYRLVCSNGMVARVAGVHEAIIHTEKAELPDIEALIVDGIASIEGERAYYSRALKTLVDDNSVSAWVDGELKKKWGALAAARTWLISQTGYDGVFLDPFDKAAPSEKKMTKTERVPGSPAKADNAYAVSQALAWIARQRLDVQEQMQYMREIPQLMQALAG